jgi:hypothetical protein
MSENFACSNCRMLLQINSEQLGKQVRCPVCGLISVFGNRTSEDAPEDWQSVGNPRPEEPPAPRAAKNRSARFQPFKSSTERGNSDWMPVPPKSTNTPPETSQPPPYVANKQVADRYVIDSSVEAQTKSSVDLLWKTGFYTSLASAVGAIFPCTCCIAFPMGPLALSIAGLVLTLTSARGPKLINFCLAGVGLVVSLLWCAMRIFGMIFGG